MRPTGGQRTSHWRVRFPGNKPKVDPGLCGPRRSNIRYRARQRKVEPEVWDDVGRQKWYLKTKIDRISFPIVGNVAAAKPGVA